MTRGPRERAGRGLAADLAASSSSRRPRLPLHSRGAVAVACVLLLAGLLSVVAPGRASAVDVPNSSVSVTVSQTTDITDGKRLVANIKSPATPVYAVQVRVCRPGVSYASSAGFLPAEDSRAGGPNCPDKPISSSADLEVINNGTYVGAQSPGGSNTSILVGTGKVDWSYNGSARSLTCDSTSPCVLLMEIKMGTPATWVPVGQALTYRPDDPVAGCGGPATGSVTSAASDRMTEAWAQWTLAECKAPGRSGAASRSSFPGEGEAVSSFDDGSVDLAYTAVGDDADVGFVKLDPAAPKPNRAAVMVPIALNSVVLATGGGLPGPGGKQAYGPVSLTLDEGTSLVSGAAFAMAPLLDAVYQRNPQLAGTGFFDVSQWGIAATAEAEGTSWIGTRHFKTLRPNLWKVPDGNLWGADRNRSRGVDAQLALADPSYTYVLNLVSGKAPMKKTFAVTNSTNSTSFGGVWLFTDLATARSFDLTVVSLGNGKGSFVTPTNETMQAAVPSMKAGTGGELLPDPAVSDPNVYPLTFVEYAMVPAEPLVNTDCTLRTGSQELLRSWLTYLVGDGQKNLAPGFAPLTPDLVTKAQAEIAKVGASKLTGTCKGADDVTTTTTTPAGDGAAAAPDGSGGDFSAGDLGDVSLPDDVAAADGGSAAGTGDSGSTGDESSADGSVGGPASQKREEKTELASSSQGLPDYAGRRGVSSLLALVAIAFVVLLTSAGARLTSRRLGRGGPGSP